VKQPLDQDAQSTSGTLEHDPADGSDSNQHERDSKEHELVVKEPGKTEEISSVHVSEAEEDTNNDGCSANPHSYILQEAPQREVSTHAVVPQIERTSPC
jgi:hypothetical protein